MTASPLLPWLAGAMLLLVLTVGFRACSDDGRDQSVTLERPVAAPSPDADSPADTVRTLTAEVADLKSQNQVVIRHNERLLKQHGEIEGQVRNDVLESLGKQAQGSDDAGLNVLTRQLDALQDRFERLEAQPAVETTDDRPIGLGLTPDGTAGGASTIVWVEPLTAGGDEQPPAKTGEAEGSLLQHNNENNEPKPKTPQAVAPQSEPRYTVPRNATLIGSKGMTALIGRIPFEGEVEDPFPFKVLVGRDNLAANGLEIPGVYGMVFSGHATGDWALSCVRGDVTSVTYVFDDGTIRTLSSDDNSLERSSTQGQDVGQNRSLGWLSDRRGIPCIAGRRISNAGPYLTGRILARGVEAAGNALATRQSTQSVSPIGGASTSTITGDAAKFAGFNALAGGFSEISDYLKERLAQSFDVIYRDTGAEIAVHIDRELPIDLDPNGRKLAYASNAKNLQRTGLD